MEVRALTPWLGASLILTAPLCLSACKFFAKKDADAGHDVQVLQRLNLMGRALGLKHREIALTLDDGPGPRTLELARWLAQEGVPATFFFVGANAADAPRTVSAVAEMRLPDGKPAFFIGNHSMNHTQPLTASPSWAAAQIAEADAVLGPHAAARGLYFMRPPYGSLVDGGKAFVASLNQRPDIAKYIGPIFWDIGGALDGQYSADWACWSRSVGYQRCHDGYVRESEHRGGGILLAHDIHSKTVDMLMGTNGSPSLVRTLRAKGFTFVALDRDAQALARFADPRARPVDFGDVSFTASGQGLDKVGFTVAAPGAERIEIWVDRLERPLLPPFPADRAEFSFQFLARGHRRMTIKASAAQKTIAMRSFGFVVGEHDETQTVTPPRADPSSVEGTSAPTETPSVEGEVGVSRARICASKLNIRDESHAIVGHALYGTPVRLLGESRERDGAQFSKVMFEEVFPAPMWVASRFVCALSP